MRKTVRLIARPVTIGMRNLFMVAVPQAITGTKRNRKYFSNPSDANKYIKDVFTLGYQQAELIRSTGRLGAQNNTLLCQLRSINTELQAVCKQALLDADRIGLLLGEAERGMR